MHEADVARGRGDGGRARHVRLPLSVALPVCGVDHRVHACGGPLRRSRVAEIGPHPLSPGGRRRALEPGRADVPGALRRLPDELAAEVPATAGDQQPLHTRQIVTQRGDNPLSRQKTPTETWPTAEDETVVGSSDTLVGAPPPAAPPPVPPPEAG